MRTLYIDIESAPAKAYVWGMKTNFVPLGHFAEDGYILCFAYRWADEDEVGFFSLWDHGYDTMIEAAWHLLDEADEIIHYNGNGYDIPRLNTEFLIKRMGPPSPAHQTDLYLGAKKFKVLSKSMKHMLSILSLDNKLEHKGMELWKGVMAGVRKDELVMEEYNIQDVIVMEDLYNELLPWMTNVPNKALWMETGIKPTCRCGSTDLRHKGYKRTKVLTYRQWHCNDCGTYMRERTAVDTGSKKRTDVLTW